MKQVIGIIFVLLLIVGCSYQQENEINETIQAEAEKIEDKEIVEEHAVDEPEKMEEVVIRNFKFSPTTLNVPVNTTVVWVNREHSDHTVTSNEFDSGKIISNSEFQYTFEEKGVFNYNCVYHPDMEGTIIVE